MNTTDVLILSVLFLPAAWSVRQWKNTFGQVLTLYQVHPEVQRILDEHHPA